MTTEEQFAVGVVGDVRLWYQLPDQLAMVSVAELWVTLLAVSVSLSGATAVRGGGLRALAGGVHGAHLVLVVGAVGQPGEGVAERG